MWAESEVLMSVLLSQDLTEAKFQLEQVRSELEAGLRHSSPVEAVLVLKLIQATAELQSDLCYTRDAVRMVEVHS